MSARSAVAPCRGRNRAPEGRRSNAPRYPHGPHRRDRPVHGEHGRHGDLDLIAGDCARSPPGPDRPQAGADVLHADVGRLHPRLGLGRRPVRGAYGLLFGHRRVHRRLDPLRRLDLARDADRRPRLSGPRGRDDGPGRAARPFAQRGEERSRRRPRLPHRPGAARARRRAAARRLHHHLLPLALDLLDQRADRRARHRPVAEIHRQSARGGRCRGSISPDFSSRAPGFSG